MPRHSKNAGGMGAEGLTYHERQALGFGTVRTRLGKEAQCRFDDCNLSLQPAGEDAVVTPRGIVYNKELILENLLRQKKAAAKRLAAWEAHQFEKERREETKRNEEGVKRAEAFDAKNATGIATSSEKEVEKSGVSKSLSTNYQKEQMEDLQAFWLPAASGSEERMVEKKPVTDTFCPATGEKLRLKDLVDIKWTKVSSGESGKYKCPVCGDTFSNASVLLCLKTTGNVVHKKCYEKFIKPDGVYGGKRVRERDIIEMQRGGTGFAAHEGEKLVSRTYNELGVHGLPDELRNPHNKW